MLDLTGYTYWTSVDSGYVSSGTTLSTGYTYIIIPYNGSLGISYNNKSTFSSETETYKIKPVDNNMLVYRGTIFRKAN